MLWINLKMEGVLTHHLIIKQLSYLDPHLIATEIILVLECVDASLSLCRICKPSLFPFPNCRQDNWISYKWESAEWKMNITLLFFRVLYCRSFATFCFLLFLLQLQSFLMTWDVRFSSILLKCQCKFEDTKGVIRIRKSKDRLFW
jgi:hypothetical protein